MHSLSPVPHHCTCPSFLLSEKDLQVCSSRSPTDALSVVISASPHAVHPSLALASVEVVEIVNLVTKSKASVISVISTDSGPG